MHSVNFLYWYLTVATSHIWYRVLIVGTTAPLTSVCTDTSSTTAKSANVEENTCKVLLSGQCCQAARLSSLQALSRIRIHCLILDKLYSWDRESAVCIPSFPSPCPSPAPAPSNPLPVPIPGRSSNTLVAGMYECMKGKRNNLPLSITHL